MNLHLYTKSIFKIFNNNNNCPRNYYYEKIIEHYKDLSEYYRIIDLLNTKKVLNTNTIISIIDNKTLKQVKKKHIIKKYKKPSFKYIVRENDLIFDIYIYKLYIGGHRTKLEIHMTSNKIFYYNFTFTGSINNDQRQDIIKIIEDKYLDGRLINVTNEIIIDANQTILHIDNSLDLKIHYMNVSSDIIDLIKSYKNKYNKERKQILENKRDELIKRL